MTTVKNAFAPWAAASLMNVDVRLEQLLALAGVRCS